MSISAASRSNLSSSRPISSLRPSPPDPNSQERSTAFRLVKPTCVQLMSLASIPPTLTSPHSRLLDQLNSLLPSLPPTAFTQSMINYLIFPITQILRSSNPTQLPENVLESIFRLLSFLVRRWRDLEGGIEIKAWEQLWRFTNAAVGPLSSNGKNKNKEMNQEIRLQAINLLSSLLEPKDNHPNDSMKKLCGDSKAVLMPTLFQTITFLLDSSTPTPPYLQLQLSALRLSRQIIRTYLKGQHAVLAAILPGTISTMVRLVQQEGKLLKGDVAELVMGLVGDIIVFTLNDEDLRTLGVLRPKVHDLSQLAEEWEISQDHSPPDNEVPSSPTPSQSSTTSQNPFPPLSSSYLSFTSAQLQAAIPPLLSLLSAHTSHQARISSAKLASELVERCHDSLPDLILSNISCLLRLSQDTFELVSQSARDSFTRLLANSQFDVNSHLIDLLSNTINSLPRLITSKQDEKVHDAAKLITAIAEITQQMSVTGNQINAIADLLGPGGNVERWSWGFLTCLELSRPLGWSSNVNSAAKSAEKGWQKGMLTCTTLLLEDGHQDDVTAFSILQFKHVESQATQKALVKMLISLGAAGGETALHSVDFLLRFAKANSVIEVSRAVSAIFVSNHLLDGIASVQLSGAEGKVGRATRKMAREMVKILMSLDEEDGEDFETYISQDNSSQSDPTSDALLPVERIQGVNAITTLLDRPSLENTHTNAKTRHLHYRSQRTLLTCISLQSLSTISHFLSSSFRPLLLTTLYTLLSHLSSSNDQIIQFASISLSHVAYNTGYATPRNLVLDNVDYVINIVSRRLTRTSLSAQAPLVLIAMIRLVGGEIVGLVQDVVDEVFDALDDYHGYETLCSGLLAVLVALIESMSQDVLSQGLSEKRKEKKKEMNRIDQAPDPEKDFKNLFKWYEERRGNNQKEIDSILKRAPQHAWGKEDVLSDHSNETSRDSSTNPDSRNKRTRNKHNETSSLDGKDRMGSENNNPPNEDSQQDERRTENEEQEEEEMGEDGEPKLTRSQSVSIEIISKSIPFLSHQSPFLRTKVLSLLTQAAPILANSNLESKLLPLIDIAWPLILARMDEDKEPYVITAATETIASLCEHVGDFMSKRILDNVWPRFARLLKRQNGREKSNTVHRSGFSMVNSRTLGKSGGLGSSRGSGGVKGLGGLGIGGINGLGEKGQTKYSVNHRLYISILLTTTWIIKEVPVDEGVMWEMMLLLRPFLSSKIDQELQDLAKDLYFELGKRDGDAVWICLESSLGKVRGVWEYLKDETLSIERNAEWVLGRI
ncbi:hypothetical protein M231_05012 [Tremella mesenterica]|uniref:Uncharacterized protein n=1 Tax=Tremella mesenterica TaxID=5217 RepID=A0A4Q1BJ79_TREME|nr:uncharacterized protein TREMEDRAFT_68736 [Tremella mesenterica DSM 1558]EIW69527.1 hypothetical protein TREMEDRAFT_68736 [Tremella mesenterica DSM 1558]RXK37763.1 hypothetical protein M231_05012 [Tremella mesenterica]